MKKILIAPCLLLCLTLVTMYYYLNPIFVYAAEIPFEIEGKSGLIMDYDSGEIIYDYNSNEKLQVASIVKLMTILLTMEDIENEIIKLDDTITTTEYASGMGGSQMFIDPFEKYSLEEMLKSVIMASANDCSVVLAEYISGSESEFVKRMNKRANELGLKDTHYVNSTGLPEPGQYSTAKDAAILLKEVMKHNSYFNYSSFWMDELIHPTGRKTERVNTNKLVRYFNGCDAGKTGSTDEAGYCLVASAKRENMRLIAVVLGAKTATERFNETSKLLNFGFSNYENKIIVNKNDAICEVSVKKSPKEKIQIYAEKDFSGIIKKSEKVAFDTTIEIVENLRAPIKNGNIVGKIIISKNGLIVSEINLIVKEDIEAFTFKDGFNEIVSKWNKK